METDWHQILQSIFIGLIFSYLLAKLISIVVSFKEENLFLTRQTKSTSKSSRAVTSTSTTSAAAAQDRPSRLPFDTEADSVIAEHGSVRSDSDNGTDDDDWEGVEITELDEAFSAATVFVAATAADRVSQKVSSDVQLQLYSLYKIATEGPCSAPPPSALKMTARAKWNAWQKLGSMPPEDAMQKYIDIVSEIYPSWVSGSMSKGIDTGPRTAETKGHMGPVFSTYAHTEEPGKELKMDAIHAFAREGELDNLLECIDNGVPVNLKDSEGRTPLHWAVDRGHLNVAEILVGKKADVNAKDDEGQTPLHYAAVCERETIAEFLVKHNADTEVKDNDGSSAKELCKLEWQCLRG